MEIKNITARPILASLGNETVEATIAFGDGSVATASVPAGISAGKYEMPKVDVTTALVQIKQINSMLSGKEWTQGTLDWEIGKMTFGANATLAVSAAFFKVTRNQYPVSSIQYPKLFLLLFEGGKHGNENISIQEFAIIEETITQAENDFAKLKDYLSQNNIETLVGAEGAFSPKEFTNEKILDTISTLFPNRPIALDLASSFETTDITPIILNTQFSQGENSARSAQYKIRSVEDPFSEEDWDRWVDFNRQYGDKLLVVGDDLTATNVTRIKKAVELKAINAVIIKPNQIGTISAALAAVDEAKKAGLKIVVSHRGEDTNDTWIVDFALNCQADFVKLGGMDRGERIAKYNRLREVGMN